MPEVFLSHKSEEKKAAKALRSSLEAHLIEVWLDEDGLQTGDVLSEALMECIQKCPVFVAQVSVRYANSRWCMEELKLAHALGKKILLVFEDEPSLVQKEGSVLINSIMATAIYSEADKYDRKKSHMEIVSALSRGKKVRFSTEIIELGGQEAVHIKVDNDRDLPDDFVSSWGFDILTHLSNGQEGAALIKTNHAVAFSGPMPQWLVAYLAIPLFNKRNVWVYNKPSGGFVCVYAQKEHKNLLGNFVSFAV